MSQADTENLRYWAEILIERLKNNKGWQETISVTKDGSDTIELIQKLIVLTKELDEMRYKLEKAKQTEEIVKQYYSGDFPEKPNAYYDSKDEYYDSVAVCEDCGCQFIGYYNDEGVARYCPSCGHKLRFTFNSIIEADRR